MQLQQDEIIDKDEVLKMARQAGIVFDDKAMPFYKTFAKLVAAKERDACAKEADKRLHDFTMLTSNPPQSGAAFSIAQAIRARGEA